MSWGGRGAGGGGSELASETKNTLPSRTSNSPQKRQHTFSLEETKRNRKGFPDVDDNGTFFFNMKLGCLELCDFEQNVFRVGLEGDGTGQAEIEIDLAGDQDVGLKGKQREREETKKQ